MSFLALFLSSRSAQPHIFSPGSGLGREPGRAPGSEQNHKNHTFAVTRAAVTLANPIVLHLLTPYSCTFTVLVLPLPGCSSNTNATPSPDFWLLCQRQLCSEPGLCHAALQGSSHTSFMHNLNVFQAYLSETELSTGREGITLSGEGT